MEVYVDAVEFDSGEKSVAHIASIQRVGEGRKGCLSWEGACGVSKISQSPLHRLVSGVHSQVSSAYMGLAILLFLPPDHR